MDFWQGMPTHRLIVECSLWSADMVRFADDICRMDPYVDMYHIDVSDGHFVPGLLFFADLVTALRPLTQRPFHVHLMTTNPREHVPAFVEAGADLITVHVENGPLMPSALEAARQLGVSTGIAVGLDVIPQAVEPYLELADMLLVMGTAMGIKGIKPSPLIYERISRFKDMVLRAGLEHKVKVFSDGGIRDHTVPALRKAGVDGVVAGSLIFKSTDLTETFEWLHGLTLETGVLS